MSRNAISGPEGEHDDEDECPVCGDPVRWTHENESGKSIWATGAVAVCVTDDRLYFHDEWSDDNT